MSRGQSAIRRDWSVSFHLLCIYRGRKHDLFVRRQKSTLSEEHKLSETAGIFNLCASSSAGGFFSHFLLHGATAVVVNQKFCFFSLYKLQSSLTLLHPTLSIIFKLKSHEVRNVSCREGMKEWRSHRDRFSDFCQCL